VQDDAQSVSVGLGVGVGVGGVREDLALNPGTAGREDGKRVAFAPGFDGPSKEDAAAVSLDTPTLTVQGYLAYKKTPAPYGPR